MDQDPRTYINNVRNNDDLDVGVLNRLETFIRGWTVIEDEDRAYRRAKITFERFRDNDTNQDKINELNDILNNLAIHLQFMMDMAQDGDGTPEQIDEIQDIINTIEGLIENRGGQQQNQYVAQGRKRRNTRKSKKSKKYRKSKKSRKSRRYRR
jgi:hypothetical protein